MTFPVPPSAEPQPKRAMTPTSERPPLDPQPSQVAPGTDQEAAGGLVTPRPRTRGIFGLLKIIVVVLGLVAASIVWFPALSASDNVSAIKTVRLSKNLNDAAAQGAPQQAVVAAWATVDYLELIAGQLDDAQANQQRELHLLFIAIATGGVLAVIRSLERNTARREPRALPVQ